MLTIHYSPSFPWLLPDNITRWEDTLQQLGKRDACRTFPNSGDIACQCFLPIAIASHNIRELDHSPADYRVIEYHENCDPIVHEYDANGELCTPLLDSDQYQFEYLF